MKRLIYLGFLVGTGVLVSFYGGSISYLLYYFALLIPVFSLCYTLYVYFRFKISQSVVARTVIKGQEIPYNLIMANEDFLPFSNITLNFFTDMVSISELKSKDDIDNNKEQYCITDNICLLPRQRINVDTKMYCKYRGTYNAGIKSVTVADFLGLFSVTYPLSEKVKLTARPRIIPLEKLMVNMEQKDPKNNLFSVSKLQELPDFELRRYYPGDSQKYIHWKSSAKAGELLVRKNMPEEMFEIVIIVDLTPIDGDAKTRLSKEDSVIEAAVSFVHDYYMKKIPVRIVYMKDKITEILVDAYTGFNRFYEISSNLEFKSKLSPDKVLQEYSLKTHNSREFILITSEVTESLLVQIKEKNYSGYETVVIDTGELCYE